MLRLPIESVSRSGPVTNLGRRVAKYAGVEDAMEKDHWIVDDFGMHSEMRDGTFEIEAHRLAELTSVEERDILYWPVYIASETRFDIERFLEAYQGALVKHAGRYGAVMDPLLLAESAEAARNIWGERPVCG
ncbi:hypothetical protein [Rhizobium tibeticum]|nr:hypothetical protein [Rhizobium tibeticum]